MNKAELIAKIQEQINQKLGSETPTKTNLTRVLNEVVLDFKKQGIFTEPDEWKTLDIRMRAAEEPNEKLQ